MYISTLDFAIWFCISLLLVSIILSDVGLLEAYFSKPEFWEILLLAVALSHLLVSKTNSNTGVINLSQAKKPKMDWLFSFNSAT